MCLPVLYRAEGESRWNEGVTINLSESGALIDGEVPACAGTIVVVIPLLPHEGCLTARGYVVRAFGADDATRHGRFAIAVQHYQMHSQPSALARLDTLHQEC